MACLRNICINTLHKGDDDHNDDDNNNNNNNNKLRRIVCVCVCVCVCVSESQRSCDGCQCYSVLSGEAEEAVVNCSWLPWLPGVLHATKRNNNLNIQLSPTLTSKFFPETPPSKHDQNFVIIAS